MYDWMQQYASFEELNNDIPQAKTPFRLCGWYIDENEYALVTRVDTNGIEHFSGKQETGDWIRFYSFSGRIQDSVFGCVPPVQSDTRGEVKVSPATSRGDLDI